MDLNARTTLYGQLSDNVNYTRQLLADFLTAYDNKEILEKIPTATWSYTQNIIINLGKIFATSKNEHFRLRRFKELGSENINERIARIESTHKDLIAKIMKNRHELFAHTGANFHKILFSKAEIERLQTRFGTVYPTLLAETKNNERFTPTDIKNDADEIAAILAALDEIWGEAIDSDVGLAGGM